MNCNLFALSGVAKQFVSIDWIFMSSQLDYGAKTSGYFGHERSEISPMLKGNNLRVLEIGCGDGATIAWLKRSGHCAYAVGIELHPASAESARRACDYVISGDAESTLTDALSRGPFDLILCLDVLEHMLDPWLFLNRLTQALPAGTRVIASVPNVQHYKVSIPLLFAGRFEYEQAGVLDQTHLRFFTRRSARKLLSTAPLEVTQMFASRPPRWSPSWWAHVLSLGLLGDLFAVQFTLAARKT
jgi:2-polyprenyl-3-methyl-5-hydroxy-6-metoxy-1,4-benzoquinol methylase